MRSVLSAGWEADRDAEPVLQAGLGHALEFTTWRSLVQDHGLRDDQAVALIVRLVADTADGNGGTPPA